MHGSRELTLVFQRTPNPTPNRSFGLQDRRKEVKVLGLARSVSQSRYVLREQHLDRAIRFGMSRQNDSQQRPCVLLWHEQLESLGVADASKRLRA
jgi:hypothetical protein